MAYSLWNISKRILVIIFISRPSCFLPVVVCPWREKLVLSYLTQSLLAAHYFFGSIPIVTHCVSFMKTRSKTLIISLFRAHLFCFLFLRMICNIYHHKILTHFIIFSLFIGGLRHKRRNLSPRFGCWSRDGVVHGKTTVSAGIYAGGCAYCV